MLIPLDRWAAPRWAARAVCAAIALASLGLVLAPLSARADPSLTGTWLVNVVTQAGSGDVTFVLEQDGEAVTGTYQGSFGERPVRGRLAGSDLELTFSAEAMGTKFDVTYTGTVADGSMSGKVVLGGFGEGTFSGRKDSAAGEDAPAEPSSE